MIIFGLIKEILPEFVKTHIYGNSDVRTAPQVLPFGIDSKPVKGKMTLFVETENRSKSAVLGIILNSDETNPGETRLYATDENGVEKFSVYFKNDGTVEFGGTDDNFVRYSELKKGFDDLKKDFNDFLSGKFAVHTHPYVNVSTPSTTSVTTTVVLPSSADISSSKIKNIKTYKNESI